MAAAAALAVLLAGCGSISETVGSMNPLRPKDPKLAGERQPFFSTNNTVESGRAASVGPQQAISVWPQPGSNPQNNSGHLAYAGSGARAWRANIGDGGGRGIGLGRDNLRISARPVIAGGNVYVYAPDGSVTALSLSGGGRVWRTSLQPEGEKSAAPGGGVAVDNGRVFVGTGYASAAALDAGSGNVVWSVELDAPVRGAPTAAAGKVFVVTQTNEVLALDQADGAIAFRFSGIPETAGLLANASPAVSGDTLVVPFSSGEVVAFDIGTGEPRWSDFVTRSIRTSAVSGLADVSASPVIAGGVVYATGVSGRTIAVSLSSGEPIWQADIGSAHTPVVSGDAVFLIDLNSTMYALDKANGKILWQTTLPRESKKRDFAWAGPLLAGDTLWAISNNGLLVTVSPTDGRLISKKEVGAAGFATPVLADGNMIVVSDAGEVSALR